ncbi:hypothetical protein ABPG72_017287 [Tetrahymena utriculariae]
MEYLRKISICIGANIFLGERGIQKMFEGLKSIQSLQYLKLKIAQGNQFGQNNGEALIQGLNSLQNLTSLNLKLSTFNNIKSNEPDIIGKCFGQLHQLESLSLTFYRYFGERNTQKEVINSIKKLIKLQDLKLKIKDSFLQIFDCYDLLNFIDVDLPNLQEFSFVVKDNTFRQPKSEILDIFLETFKLSKDFIQEKSHERLLTILGIFKQIILFKSVKRLSLSFDKIVPLYFIQKILELLKDVQNLIFPKLKMSIHSFETPEDIIQFTYQLSKFQGIKDLQLKLQEEIYIINFFQLLKELTQLKNLQKFSFAAAYISELTYMSDLDEFDSEEEWEEEQENKKEQQENEEQKIDDGAKYEEFKEKEEDQNIKQKMDNKIFQEIKDQAKQKYEKEEKQEKEMNLKNQYEQQIIKKEQKLQNLIESLMNQDVINYYSNLKESSFKIKSYQFDQSYKQISFNQFISQLDSIKRLKISYFYDNYENEQNDIQKFQINKLLCSNLTELKISFCYFEQDFNLIQFFDTVKTLRKLEKLLIILKSQYKMNTDQTLSLKQVFQNLQNLKQLTFNSSFQQSENLVELQNFFEGLYYLNLEKLSLQIPQTTFDSSSAQYFSDKIGKLKIEKIFHLTILNNNQFFINGADVFLQSIISFQQIVEFDMKLQKENIQKEQVRNIFSQLHHLRQLQRLKIALNEILITEEDISFIRDSLKQLQQLQQLTLMFDSFLVIYLMNLHQDLPFLSLVSCEYFDLKLKRNGLNRIKFCKQEAQKLLNNNQSIQESNQKCLQKNFQLIRVKIDFKNSISRKEFECKWVFQNLIMPQNIELKITSVSQSSYQKIEKVFKNFSLHQKIRYVKLNWPKRIQTKPYQSNIENIFYKIKYLVEFKQVFI